MKKKIAAVISKNGLVGGGEQFALRLMDKIVPCYDVHVSANAAIAHQHFYLIHTHDRILSAEVFALHVVLHRFEAREIREKRLSLFDRVTALIDEKLIVD